MDVKEVEGGGSSLCRRINAQGQRRTHSLCIRPDLSGAILGHRGIRAVEQLEANYGHHHPEFQEEAAEAFGSRRQPAKSLQKFSYRRRAPRRNDQPRPALGMHPAFRRQT